MKISNISKLNRDQLDNCNNKQVNHKFKEILSKTVNNSKEMKDDELKKVSEEFESIFVSMMFKQMRDAGFKSDLLDSGLSRDVFEDMYYDEVAKETAKSTKLGIAEAVYRQLNVDL